MDLADHGITHLRKIGEGQYNGGESADDRVVFYAYLAGTFECRVANTNVDPVFEEVDSAVFAELAEACGVELD